MYKRFSTAGLKRKGHGPRDVGGLEEQRWLSVHALMLAMFDCELRTQLRHVGTSNLQDRELINECCFVAKCVVLCYLARESESTSPQPLQ